MKKLLQGVALFGMMGACGVVDAGEWKVDRLCRWVSLEVGGSSLIITPRQTGLLVERPSLTWRMANGLDSVVINGKRLVADIASVEGVPYASYDLTQNIGDARKANKQHGYIHGQLEREGGVTVVHHWGKVFFHSKGFSKAYQEFKSCQF